MRIHWFPYLCSWVFNGGTECDASAIGYVVVSNTDLAYCRPHMAQTIRQLRLEDHEYRALWAGKFPEAPA